MSKIAAVECGIKLAAFGGDTKFVTVDFENKITVAGRQHDTAVFPGDTKTTNCFRGHDTTVLTYLLVEAPVPPRVTRLTGRQSVSM